VSHWDEPLRWLFEMSHWDFSSWDVPMRWAIELSYWHEPMRWTIEMNQWDDLLKWAIQMCYKRWACRCEPLRWATTYKVSHRDEPFDFPASPVDGIRRSRHFSSPPGSWKYENNIFKTDFWLALRSDSWQCVCLRWPLCHHTAKGVTVSTQ